MHATVTRLLRAVRWHWWTDDTVAAEVAVLLRSLGWLVQLARLDPGVFQTRAFVQVLAVSQKGFWLLLLAGVLALVIASYRSRWLSLRIAGALGYIFWWSFVVYILARLDSLTLSLPDAAVSGLVAFWLLIRLSRRAGLAHAGAKGRDARD